MDGMNMAAMVLEKSLNKKLKLTKKIDVNIFKTTTPYNEKFYCNRYKVELTPHLHTEILCKIQIGGRDIITIVNHSLAHPDDIDTATKVGYYEKLVKECENALLNYIVDIDSLIEDIEDIIDPYKLFT